MTALTVSEMVNYHRWANLRMLQHMLEIDKEVYTKEVKSVFPSIAKVFEHLYEVDLMWLDRMGGRKSALEKPATFDNIETTIKLFELLSKSFEDFLLNREVSNDMVEYTNSKAEVFHNTLEEIMTHLMNHGTYHRGNITAILHQLDQKSISTDYIFFLRQNK